jgi:hypothetical protein
MAKALEPPPPKRGCILVVSHAHYLSVVAHAVAVAAKLSEDAIRLILDANVGEVSGFRVSLNPPGVTYLGEKLPK